MHKTKRPSINLVVTKNKNIACNTIGDVILRHVPLESSFGEQFCDRHVNVFTKVHLAVEHRT